MACGELNNGFVIPVKPIVAKNNIVFIEEIKPPLIYDIIPSKKGVKHLSIRK
jgi:hypothetical protein